MGIQGRALRWAVMDTVVNLMLLCKILEVSSSLNILTTSGFSRRARINQSLTQSVVISWKIPGLALYSRQKYLLM
jgi:hypothetical protein